MTLQERITAQVDADLAKNGLLDAVKTPEDLKTLNRYRRMQIETAVMMTKLGPIPKP